MLQLYACGFPIFSPVSGFMQQNFLSSFEHTER